MKCAAAGLRRQGLNGLSLDLAKSHANTRLSRLVSRRSSMRRRLGRTTGQFRICPTRLLQLTLILWLRRTHANRHVTSRRRHNRMTMLVVGVVPWAEDTLATARGRGYFRGRGGFAGRGSGRGGGRGNSNPVLDGSKEVESIHGIDTSDSCITEGMIDWSSPAVRDYCKRRRSSALETLNLALTMATQLVMLMSARSK